MKQNVHIYSQNGAETGVLGWILQQSPTYVTKNFRCSDDLFTKFRDPWDNHNSDPNHWSHRWIEIQEEQWSEMELLEEEIVSKFPTPSLWGISYGAWANDDWEPETLTRVYINNTEKLFRYWWKIYAKRPIKDIKESFDMHIHDHRQDDPVYKERMYDVFGEYLQMEQVEFWKLQTAFHWGLDRIAQDSDEQHFIEMNMQHENFYEADIIIEDMFDIDLKDLCNELGCEYTEQMKIEYNRFLTFAEETLNDN